MVVVERHDEEEELKIKAERMKEAEVKAEEVKTEEEAESQRRNAVGSGVRKRGGGHILCQIGRVHN